MKRFIVHKDDLKHLSGDRDYIDAVETLGSDKVITTADNLLYANLPYVSICLTDAEQSALIAAGATIVEETKQKATLGRYNGGGLFTPDTTYPDFPFVETGFDKMDNRNIRGVGVKIGQMDSGANETAPHYVADYRINLTSADPSTADNFNHGGHILGQVHAEYWGCAPGSIYHVIKVIDDDGNLTQSCFLAGIDYGIAQGFNIMLMAFQLFTDRTIMQTAITNLVVAGCLPVCSSGNGGSSTPVVTPANLSGAIAVGSSREGFVVASHTSFQLPLLGHGVNILSPGELVPYGGIYGENKTGVGTSFAIAYVAGAIACMMEYYKIDVFHAWQIIQANALGSSNPLHGVGFLNCP